MNKQAPRPKGKCPDCGGNLYRQENESDPTHPEDRTYTFYTLDCEQEKCGYWRHEEPEDRFTED